MKLEKNQIEKAKQNAAFEAVKNVKDGFIVGLGSGSTVAYAIKELGKKIRHKRLKIFAIPTSYQAFLLAAENKIPITTLDEHPTIDLTIDGADQIDDKLNLIKGMGGALAREKIVASASKQLIIIADESKKVKTLGENNHPIPLEVLPFATSIVMQKITQIKGKPVLREGIKKVGPVITDNGNFIIDAYFGPILKPDELTLRLKSLVGVVETGLFINMAHIAYIGSESSVKKLVARDFS